MPNAPGTAAPSDLELLIELTGSTLRFRLKGRAGGYNFRDVGETRLTESPRELLERSFNRLSAWAWRTPADRTAAETEAAQRELAEIGANLYRDLFPPELKREYPELRARHRGGNLTITTNDPWIPWELVRPYAYDAARQILYDEPLCETFRLARWVTDVDLPDQPALHRAVVIQPEPDLPAAAREREYFAVLPAQRPGLTVNPPLDTVKGVLDSFSQGETQLYHFACHGNFDSTVPADSPIELSDGRLTPSQITLDREAGLIGAHPLVFINACHGGKTGRGLTRPDGWPLRYIAAGASAFIGSLWQINDELAGEFAVAFYDRLFGVNGQATPLPIAEAFYQARQVIKARDPANPTWLAYVLYANPRTRVHQAAAGAPPVAMGEPSRGTGHSARLEQWLRGWGFSEDPFATADADNEGEVLWEFLLPRRYMGVMGDDPERPVSRSLVGERGAGKTAAREAVRRDCVQGRVKAFPIRYVRFDHLLSRVAYNPALLAPRDHVDALLRVGFETLVSSLGRDLLAELDPVDSGRLLSLAAAFASPLAQAALAQHINGNPALVDWARGEPAEALQAFVNIVTRAPTPPRARWEAVYVLVDRVDEPAVPKDGALPLLRSLVRQGDLLNVERLAFKLFLHPTVGAELLADSGIPSGRLDTTVIKWDGDHLGQMIGRRLAHYSGFGVSDIEQLGGDPHARQLLAQLCTRAATPAQVLSWCEELLQRHVARTAASHFDQEDFPAGWPAAPAV